MSFYDTLLSMISVIFTATELLAICTHAQYRLDSRACMRKAAASVGRLNGSGAMESDTLSQRCAIHLHGLRCK